MMLYTDGPLSLTTSILTLPRAMDAPVLTAKNILSAVSSGHVRASRPDDEVPCSRSALKHN